MAYFSLYRKYRPDSWDKVIGQEHITRTLINQIKNGSVAHAYLFTGTRGTGKTSSAKLFARSVNCENPQNGSPCDVCKTCLGLNNPSNMDILEMDAASNNGVDEIRDLRENVQYPPTVGKYKVYIIDEVHMLSMAAFNALLKTLEEPPSFAIFILATTEVHKVPQTILSRCIRFDFRTIGAEKLSTLLSDIFDKENYKYEKRAVHLLAEHAEGSARDMLSLAEMCMAYSPKMLTYDAVSEVLGVSDFETLRAISEAVLSNKPDVILKISADAYAKGKGMGILNRELCGFLGKLLSVKNIKDYTAGFDNDEYAKVLSLAENYDNYKIGRALEIFSEYENKIRYSIQPKILFDAAAVKAAELRTDPSAEALISRINLLENRFGKIESGAVTVNVSADKPQTAVKNENVVRDSEPPKTASQKSDNIENLLKKYATPLAETEDVFKDAEKPLQKAETETDKEARGLFGSLLTLLRENGNIMLYYGLSKEENYSLSGKEFVLYTDERATVQLLETANNMQTVQNLLREVSGADYTFAYKTHKDGKQILRQNVSSLKEVFGDKFIDKSIK